MVWLGDDGGGTTDRQGFGFGVSGADYSVYGNVASGSGPSNTGVNTANVTSLNTRHIGIATFDSDGGKTQTAMLDGGTMASTTSSYVPSGINNMTVGCRHYYSLTTDGQTAADMSWVAVWNTALSEDEQRAVTTGVHPYLIQPGALVCFLPLTGASAGSEVDVIGGRVFAETGTVGVTESPLLPIGSAIYVSGAAFPEEEPLLVRDPPRMLEFVGKMM